LAHKYDVVFFPNIYTLDILKEQIADPKNDDALLKYAGLIAWLRALVLILWKEDPTY
jgi:hypothetical protein